MGSGDERVLRREDIRILRDLGLTSLQARAYLALSDLGTATMKSIAKGSGIARQDLYRIMPQLHQMGLAEKIITTPSMFKATPLEDGVNVLLRHKQLEYDQLKAKTKELIAASQNPTVKKTLQIDPSKFFVISEMKLLYKILSEKNQHIRSSLRVSGTWESTRRVLFDAQIDSFKKALANGVSIKWITEDHENDPSTEQELACLRSYPLFEIRYFTPPIPLQAAIYDERDVVMCIAPPPSSDVTSIASDNLMFVKMALNYWEEVWNAASKDHSGDPAVAKRQRLVTQ